MPTPKKLPSGRWRCQVYLGKRNGKNVYASITEDTKTDCMYKAALAKAAGLPEPKPEITTVGDLVDEYIESCELLSPTTVSGYEKIRRNMFKDLMQIDVREINLDTLQKAINAEMRRENRRGHNYAPKAIRNAYGLITASLRHAGMTTPPVKLPKDEPKFLELPSPAIVIEAVRGTDIELPCMLALWLSLSMSEVRGLKYSSIRNGCLYIDQVVVDVDGRPVEKQRAKVASRNRCLALPPELLELIKKNTQFEAYQRGEISNGYIEPRKEFQIRRHLNKILPGITFHQLRHLNASVMLQLNIPDKYAMERGGWSTPSTMKRVYQHTFSEERQKVDCLVDSYFRNLISHSDTHEH